MKILLTGAHGYIGRRLKNILKTNPSIERVIYLGELGVKSILKNIL